MEFEIRLAAHHLAELERALFARADVESKAFVLCSRAAGARRLLLLGREVLPVPESAYTVRTATRVVTAGPFVEWLLNRCAAEGLALLEAHSHPWTEAPRFSGIDDASDARKFAATRGLPPPFEHATPVFGQGMGYQARLFDRRRGRPVPIRRLTVLGTPLRYLAAVGVGERALSARQAALFDRQVRALGEEGQALLAGLTVAVVGSGGLGSQITQALALLGVGGLTLIDKDCLEVSNANRQVLVSGRQVRRGEGKAVALARSLATLFRSPRVTVSARDVREAACWPHLLDADLLVGAVDSAATRHFLNAFACCALMPYLDGGVGVRTTGGRISAAGGQVRSVVPGSTPCLACLDGEVAERSREEATPKQRALSVRAGYIQGERIPAPQVAFLNGVVGNALAWEFVKLATGCLPGAPYVYYDLATPAMFAAEELERREDCLACSSEGLLARGANGIEGLTGNAGRARPPLPRERERRYTRGWNTTEPEGG